MNQSEPFKEKNVPMSDNKNCDTGIDPAELRQLLGPAPILSTESADQFEKVLDRLIAALKPRDMVEGLLIWDFAIPSWEINRYARHRTVAFDRGFKQDLEFQVQRIKNEKARREDLAANLANHLSQKPADIAQLARLELQIKNADTEIDKILKSTPSELDHHRALEKAITFHKDLEFLITSLTKRRNNALEMLELYRAGLGKRVDEALNDILDAEYKVVGDQSQQMIQAPSLVPSMDPTTTRREVGEPCAEKTPGPTAAT